MRPERKAPEIRGSSRARSLSRTCFNEAGAESSGNHAGGRVQVTRDERFNEAGAESSGNLSHARLDRSGLHASMRPERKAPEIRSLAKPCGASLRIGICETLSRWGSNCQSIPHSIPGSLSISPFFQRAYKLASAGGGFDVT